MDTLAPPNAILYARRSQKQDNRASVTDQVAGGQEACKEHGWKLAGVIDQDDDRSASRFARQGRPGWEQLLISLRAGAAGIVILWESSRGDRKLSEWAAFLDECRERGVRIHVVSHDRTYDLRKHRDWKTLADDGVNSAYESEHLSARIRRGITSAAHRGDPYAVAPYGLKTEYHQDTGKRAGWVIVPDRAAVVREIFVRIIAHDSVRAIRRDLDARGVPTVRGGPWSEQRVREIAMNPAYAALLRLPDGSLADGNWPAIVDRATWNSAMAVLRPRQTGKRPGGQRHLMTYLANCECGSPVTARRVKGEFRYSCRKGSFYIPCEWLDELVADVICERLSRPDARDMFKSDDKRSGQLRNELAGLRSQLDEWAGADISARAYAIKEKKLLPQIEARQSELDALTIPPALASILKASDVRAAWETYTVQARRAIIAAVTGVEICRGLAPEGTPPGVTRGRAWVRFTGEPVRNGMRK